MTLKVFWITSVGHCRWSNHPHVLPRPLLRRGRHPAHGGPSIRHTTRSFPNREGSKPGIGQIASAALMDARSAAASAANGGRITAGGEYACLEYHSNPMGLAEFTLSRRVPEYAGKAVMNNEKSRKDGCASPLSLKGILAKELSEPAEKGSGIEFELESVAIHQFWESIKRTVLETLERLAVEGAAIHISVQEKIL